MGAARQLSSLRLDTVWPDHLPDFLLLQTLVWPDHLPDYHEVGPFGRSVNVNERHDRGSQSPHLGTNTDVGDSEFTDATRNSQTHTLEVGADPPCSCWLPDLA
jgi:hypothetical protein